jgi:asparagine synthase (glutamine-hydrolysing)
VCGIAGLLGGSSSPGEIRAIATAMADVLAHRGPDDVGVWVDPGSRVGLGHRRLSVIDTTAAGRQPMVSRSGRSVLVYNGEIYNFQEIRANLEKRGVILRSGTDSEVLLEACELWGVESTVSRCVGMFAFAFWDIQREELRLVRDRLGIKPLYWARLGGGLAFASELRGIRQHPAFRFDVNRDALAAYLRRNCVPAPLSIFEGVNKLPPGCVLTYRQGSDPAIEPFWTLENAVRDARKHRLDDISDAEGMALVEATVAKAVGSRMVADVPLGAFLSGGVDSSAVVAVMQEHSTQPVRTFSLGSTESDHDEAPHARRVAQHLRTDHTELYVSPLEAMAVIPELPQIFDEPFADSSQVPTYLVSRLARSEVTVAMSGDGGDEVFAGYNRHRIAHSKLYRLLGLPVSARRAVSRSLLAIPVNTWHQLVEVGPRRYRGRRVADNLHKFAGILRADGPDQVHELLASHWVEPNRVVVGGREPPSAFDDPAVGALLADPMDRMLYLDTITYLTDDILTKVDRASMAVSLEARVPLLDHRLVELLWRLPQRFRIRDGVTKWALRQVLHSRVPSELIDRPKHGFGMPIGAWLRAPLRDWAEQLLEPRRMRDEGFFDPAPVRALWEEHLAGRGAWQYHLWDILMFQAWLEAQG